MPFLTEKTRAKQLQNRGQNWGSVLPLFCLCFVCVLATLNMPIMEFEEYLFGVDSDRQSSMIVSHPFLSFLFAHQYLLTSLPYRCLFTFVTFWFRSKVADWVSRILDVIWLMVSRELFWASPSSEFALLSSLLWAFSSLLTFVLILPIFIFVVSWPVVHMWVMRSWSVVWGDGFGLFRVSIVFSSLVFSISLRNFLSFRRNGFMVQQLHPIWGEFSL